MLTTIARTVHELAVSAGCCVVRLRSHPFRSRREGMIGRSGLAAAAPAAESVKRPPPDRPSPGCASSTSCGGAACRDLGAFSGAYSPPATQTPRGLLDWRQWPIRSELCFLSAARADPARFTPVQPSASCEPARRGPAPPRRTDVHMPASSYWQRYWERRSTPRPGPKTRRSPVSRRRTPQPTASRREGQNYWQRTAAGGGTPR